MEAYHKPQPRCLLSAPLPTLHMHTCTHVCPWYTINKRPTADMLQATLYSLWYQEAPGWWAWPLGGGGWGFSWRGGRCLSGATACHGCDAQTEPGGEGPRSRCCPCNPPSPAGTAAHGSQGTGTQPTCRQRCGACELKGDTGGGILTPGGGGKARTPLSAPSSDSEPALTSFS